MKNTHLKHFTAFVRGHTIHQKNKRYLCAVKTVLEPKDGDSAAEAAAAENDLLNEALLMAQVDQHKHLVSLIGVVTRGKPKMLLLSYCEHGDLQVRALCHCDVPSLRLDSDLTCVFA